MALSPGLIASLFPGFPNAPKATWNELAAAPVGRPLLNLILSYAQSGPLSGLNNRILYECRPDITFYEGLPGNDRPARLHI